MNLFTKRKPTDSNRFAVILAGGEGSRLKGLTRVITGDERPKQFCPILNGETLIGLTQKRVALKIQPENTFFSLTECHDKYYKKSLSGISSGRLIVQPENKGTAPAILYSLMRLAAVNPNATVAFFPSDHYFSDDLAFMKSVETAFNAAEGNLNSVILLGVKPDSPETSYGWVEPVESLFGDLSNSVSRVKCFWEKPGPEPARYLLEKGCLWNSFVMIGKIRCFLGMFRQHQPQLFSVFEAAKKSFGKRDEPDVIQNVYSRIADSNFSNEILEKSVDNLFVLRIGDVVWSDLGEPQRVVGMLENLGLKLEWMHSFAV